MKHLDKMRHYANGGNVKRQAQKLARYGEGQDKILAHINPQEAMMLARTQGMDINPHTGLPQYGKFWKTVGRGLAKVAGTVVGGMLGGPVGSIIGGGLGGYLTGGKHKKDHLLGGVLTGGLGAMFPGVTQGIGNMVMGGGKSLMGSLGIGGGSGGMGAMGTGLAASQKFLQQEKKQYADVPQSSFFGSLLDTVKKDPLGTALVGTALAGTLFGREKKQKDSAGGPGGYDAAYNMRNMDTSKKINLPPLNRKYIKPAAHAFDPYGFNDSSEKPSYEGNVSELQLAHGGHAQGGYTYGNHMGGGYVDDASGGIADKVKTQIPEGSYVMDATTVSLLGDGNSANGKVKIKEFEQNLPGSSFMSYHSKPRPIKAYLSGGESVIPTNKVTALGKGNNKRGAKELDKLRSNLRKQKGIKKLLPPKAKKITSYLD